MSQYIYINFINIDSDNFFNLFDSLINIKKLNNQGVKIFNYEYNIKFDFISNTNIKKYYIEVDNIDIIDLTTENFSLRIDDFLFKYLYSKIVGENEKSLIIFNNNNYFQFVYLGLPNLKKNVEILVDYTYYYIKIESEIDPVIPDFKNDKQNIMLLNNYQGINNYLQNSIFLDGSIYKIKINQILDINEPLLNNYNLFNINEEIMLNRNTFIYIYNDIRLFSSIIYLNSYSFSEYKLFSENYETIILSIDYSDNIDNENVKYSVVLSLNLQTFNSTQLNSNSNENYYYNVLFFYNYINRLYSVRTITMFDFDYDKYFINTFRTPEYKNIGLVLNNLYDKLIANDINLETPIIPNLNYYCMLINIDLINLINLLKYNCENNYLVNFLQSNKITIDTLVSYLVNFKFIKYNVYKIINLNNIETDNLINEQKKTLVNYNYNYVYNNINTYKNKNNTTYEIINFNNNIVNSIRCRVIFLLGQYGNYSIYGKFYLNNYNIEIYHKEYNIDNIENKKKLVRLLLCLASVSWGIKLILYNDINSEPSLSSFYNNYLNTNPFYLFNEINLSRNLNNFTTYFDIISLNNNYSEQYLKFNLQINLNYYILFLYSNKNPIIEKYDQLIFNYSQYIFKIFKNNDINGNVHEHKDLFYIGFQDLKQLNVFMEYLSTGIFNQNITNLSNYFNIEKSVIFCNYYNINNYWILDSLPGPMVPDSDPNISNKHTIYFSIKNLYVNQIYLHGDLNINLIN